jgi:hypothetical protein
VWNLSPQKFSKQKVIYFHPTNVDGIYERLNYTDKDVVAEYFLEFIYSSHDLKKSTSSLKKFLLKQLLEEFAASSSRIQGEAKGSKKCPRDPSTSKGSDSQKKSLSSS